MSKSNFFDMVIIGAGVVGAAIAEKAARDFPWCRIAVLEKNKAPGLEASSHNSGVLHSPFQQPSGWLKAQFAARGCVLARDFAREHGVPLLDSSGMILAVPYSQIKHMSMWYEGAASMWKLLSRGSKHNMDFSILTGNAIRELEPNIQAAFGVFLPGISVIDSSRFVQALVASAEANGAQFFYQNEVKSINVCNSSKERFITVATNVLEIEAGIVINAAGLYADDIANLAFGEERYRQYPWSGEYYRVINPEKQNLVSRLVYPVVSPKYPGKGIHFGPRPDGTLFLGPNARKMSSKIFCREKHSPPDEFLNMANAFGAGLLPKDVEWSHAGVRPTLSPTGEEKDFQVVVESMFPLLINLLGIASPGISASMALAEHVLQYVVVKK